MSGFDLHAAAEHSKAEDAGQTIHINGPNGDPLMHGAKDDQKPVTMRVVGSFSETYRRAEEAAARKRINNRKRQTEPSAPREFMLDIASRCVVEWDGFFDSGKVLECNPTNVRKVLELAPWVRLQVEAAIDDHEVFSAGQ